MQLASKEGFYKSYNDSVGMTAITNVGNVWKSFDQGQTWLQITSAQNANALSTKMSNVAGAIMSSYAQPGVMFALEGANGTNGTALTAQVYRSLNGIDWQRAGNATLPANTFYSGGNPTNGVKTLGIFETSSRIYAEWWGEFGVKFLDRTAVSYNTGAATSATMTNIINSATSSGTRASYGNRIVNPSVNDDVGLKGVTYDSFAASTSGAVLQGGTVNNLYAGNPTPFPSGSDSASTSNWVFDRFANTFAAFRYDGVLVTNPSFAPTTSPTISVSGTNFGSGFYNISTSTYAIPTDPNIFPVATGNFYVAGRGDTGNTFYTWTPNRVTQTSAWTTRTVGTSTANAPHQVCGTNRGQLIYRTGVSTNQAWWTIDSCATLTARNLPETAIWRGVFWNY